MIVEPEIRAAVEVPVTRHNPTKPQLSPTASPAIQSRSAARICLARHRKRQGAVVVDFLIGADAIPSMIELGWLDPAARGNRDAVADAIISLTTRALALRIRPGA
jgi:hypothetical protein